MSDELIVITPIFEHVEFKAPAYWYEDGLIKSEYGSIGPFKDEQEARMMAAEAGIAIGAKG